MVTQVPSGGLTSVEQSLVEHVGRGEWLDLAADDEAVDEAAMRSWGDSRTCRATVIRDILRGRLAADPDPHGLRLRGARITGRLDLENLTTDVNLELKDCLLEEGVLARDARLASVGLAGCQLEHPAEPPLDADRLTCSVLDLSRARIIGHADTGAVSLLGAHIGGQPRLRRGEPAQRLRPRPGRRRPAGRPGHVPPRRVHRHRRGDDGAVRLAGARIGGQLDCAGAELRNDSGPALVADGLQVGQHVPPRRFTATGSGDDGAVRLLGARIGGSLDCDGAELRNDSGPALSPTACRSARTCSSAAGSPPPAAAATARSACPAPTSAASLDCDGASLRNDSGPALAPTACRSTRTCSCGGFTATGSGDDRRGPPARRPHRRPARLQRGGAAQRLRPRPGRRRPAGRPGHVPPRRVHRHRQRRARRGPPGRRPHRRQLDCAGAELRNDSGPALVADSLQVGQDMYLTGGFTATGGGDDVAVDLTGARVGGTLVFDPARLEHAADPHRRLAVDGLTYAGVPERISARDWLDLLRDGTPAMPRSRISSWPPGTGRWATNGRPARS